LFHLIFIDLQNVGVISADSVYAGQVEEHFWR